MGKPLQARWVCRWCGAAGWWTPSMHIGKPPLHDHDRPDGHKCRLAGKTGDDIRGGALEPERKPLKFEQPRANPAVCWLCDRRLYGGGRAYVMVMGEDGKEHPAHKLCADNEKEGGG